MKDLMIMDPNKLLIAPNPKDPKLAKPVVGRDQNGIEISTKVTKDYKSQLMNLF